MQSRPPIALLIETCASHGAYARFTVNSMRASNGEVCAFCSFPWNGDAMRDQITGMLDQAGIGWRAMREGESRMIVVNCSI